MYDLELLYDLQVLLHQGDYAEYRFSTAFFYRNGRPLKSEHRLRTARISKGSPLEVELLTEGAKIAVVWAFLQALMKIESFRLNRQKTKLEIEKLKLEVLRMERQATGDLDRRAEERQANQILSNSHSQAEFEPDQT
jgi:hypothetical protein